MKVFLLVLVLVATSCGKVTEDQDYRPSPRTQIAAFTTALDAFKFDCGRLPSTAEGLVALTTRPRNITEAQWHGPYLDAALPQDAWGHDYVYRCPGIHNTNGFDLYSLGPDGKTKSDGEDPDDVANWPQRKAHQ